MTQRGEGHGVYQDCYCEEARNAADVISTLSVIPLKMSSFKSFSEVGTTSAALGHKNNLTNWRRNVLDDWFDSPKTYFNKSNFMKQLARCAGAVGWQADPSWKHLPAGDPLRKKSPPDSLSFSPPSSEGGSEGSEECQPMYPSHHLQCLQETLRTAVCVLPVTPVSTDEAFPCLWAKWAGNSPNNVKP